MFLLAALSLVTPQSHACSPAEAQVLASSPADGATDVLRDVVITLQTGEGYSPSVEELEVEVLVDGEPVDVTVEGWQWARDLTEQTGFYTITPSYELPPGGMVEARISGGSIDETISFETGPEPTEAPLPSPPSISLVSSSYQDGLSGGAMSSCDTESWRELDLELAMAEEDPEGISWVVVHRVELDGSEGDPIAVVGPLSGTGPQDLTAIINDWDLDGRELGEECLAARTLDGTGRSSEASATVCIDPKEADDVGGCSTVAAPHTLLGLALSLLGLAGIRRRRE